MTSEEIEPQTYKQAIAAARDFIDATYPINQQAFERQLAYHEAQTEEFGLVTVIAACINRAEIDAQHGLGISDDLSVALSLALARNLQEKLPISQRPLKPDKELTILITAEAYAACKQDFWADQLAQAESLPGNPTYWDTIIDIEDHHQKAQQHQANQAKLTALRDNLL